MSSLADYLPTIPEETLPHNHHDQKQPESSPATSKPPRSKLRKFVPQFNNSPPFKTWLKTSWLDILTQLTCLLIAELIYLFATPLMPRFFPLFDGVWTTSWGLQHSKPFLTEYITTPVSAVISFAAPFAIMGAIGLWYTRDFWESNAAVRTSSLPLFLLQRLNNRQSLGLGYALATATLFQSFIKWFIGGLRPHFLTVCAPRGPLPPSVLGAKGHAV